MRITMPTQRNAAHPQRPLFALAGIRAGESAASPSHASDVVSRAVVVCMRGLARIHRSRLRIACRDAFAYRCGGSTVWFGPCVNRRRTAVSRLTARARNARASTRSPRSVGATAGCVKEARRLQRPWVRGLGGGLGEGLGSAACARGLCYRMRPPADGRGPIQPSRFNPA